MSTPNQAQADWREFSLGALLNFSNGINADKSAYGHGVPFVNVLEVITHESLGVGDIPGRVSLPGRVLSRYRISRGDLLFNRTSETHDEVGLSSVFLDDEPVVFGGFVFRGRPTTSEIDIGFSKYVLRGRSVRQQIIARGQGGIRTNIGQRDLKSVRVQLPKHAEQRVIAEALDDASDLIRCLKQMIVKKQEIKRGMMQQLLTGRTRLPGYVADWRQVKLGSVARMGSGGTPPSSVTRYYGGGIPWVSISDMTKGGKYIRHTEDSLTVDGLAASAAKLYDAGAVLYAMYASLGECSLAVGSVSSSQAILGISVGPQLNREFLYYYLQSIKAGVRLLGQQGAQSNLNAGMVRAFDIPLLELDEQSAISKKLSDADAEITALQGRIIKTRAIKTGMMQRLLTGRTRLPLDAAS